MDHKELRSKVNRELKRDALGGLTAERGEQITDGLSSGSMMLNVALSGSPFVGYVWGRIAEVYGPESCLEESTFIQYAIRTKEGKWQNHKGGSVRCLYERFHGIKRKGKGAYQRKEMVDSVFYAFSINEANCVFKNAIADVVDSGIKHCSQVITRRGHKLICTKDQQFYIGTTYRPLGQLEIGSIVYIHKNGMCIHHKDVNRRNDAVENLELKVGSVHKRESVLKNHNGFRSRVIEDTIVAIRPIGYRQTYDIKCYAPYNNFIADKFVVHNSGKTTLALHAMREAQRLEESSGKPVPCLFVDMEHALDPYYAESLGINLDNLTITQPGCAEDALNEVESSVRAGYKLIVIDSVSALTPRAEIDGEMGESHMGLQARIMSQALRKLNGITSEQGAILLFINQIRVKIGVSFGNPEVTSGGSALKFYATYRIEIRSPRGGKKMGKTLMGYGAEEDVEIGTITNIKVGKNKVFPPHRKASFHLVYGHGIDKIKDTVAFLEFAGAFKKNSKAKSNVMKIATKGKLYTAFGLAKILHEPEVQAEVLETIRKLEVK